MAELVVPTRAALWEKIRILREEKDALGDLLKEAQARVFMADGSSDLYNRITVALHKMEL